MSRSAKTAPFQSLHTISRFVSSSQGIMSTPSLPPSVGNVERWLCGLTSFSSRGTYIVRCSNSRSDNQYEQGSCGNRSLSRSDSLNSSLSRSSSLQEWMCPPLPGQVPVEPVKSSNVPTAQGAMKASPVNKSSTGGTE